MRKGILSLTLAILAVSSLAVFAQTGTSQGSPLIVQLDSKVLQVKSV